MCIILTLNVIYIKVSFVFFPLKKKNICYMIVLYGFLYKGELGPLVQALVSSDQNERNTGLGDT